MQKRKGNVDNLSFHSFFSSYDLWTTRKGLDCCNSSAGAAGYPWADSPNWWAPTGPNAFASKKWARTRGSPDPIPALIASIYPHTNPTNNWRRNWPTPLKKPKDSAKNNTVDDEDDNYCDDETIIEKCYIQQNIVVSELFQNSHESLIKTCPRVSV